MVTRLMPPSLCGHLGQGDEITVTLLFRGAEPREPQPSTGGLAQMFSERSSHDR